MAMTLAKGEDLSMSRARVSMLSVVFVVFAVLSATSCVVPPTAQPPTGVTGACGVDEAFDGPAEQSWWALGDSVFAGVGSFHTGAPNRLVGVRNLAIPGTTLVAVPNQSTVRTEILCAIRRNGTPEKVLIHAGGADMFARVLLGRTSPTEQDYGAAMLEIDSLLTELGVEVYWTTVAPFASSSIPAPANGMRLKLNDWMRTNLPVVIDCESALLDDNGRWLRSDYALPNDGVHLNAAGATAHAACLSAATGLELVA